MHERYLRVEGSAQRRGEAVGRAWRQRIITIFKYAQHATVDKDGRTLSRWLPHARDLVPHIEQWAPDTLAEMKGMALGAGLAFDDILLLTCAYEKWFNYHAADHCTGFAAMGSATSDGTLICGQTNDESLLHWAAGQLDGVLHHCDSDGMETLLYTHPGIPAYMGMNSAGLCLLWMAIENGERASGLPTNVLIRETLRRTSLAAAEDYIRTVPRSLPNNYLMSHPVEGICNIECTPGRFVVTRSERSLCHTNHILDPAMAAGDLKKKDPASSTLARYRAMTSLLKAHDGCIDLPQSCAMLSDHSNYPESICTHPRPAAVHAKTLAALLFQPGTGRMHIAFGNACETPFRTFSFSAAALQASSAKRASARCRS